MWPFKCKKKLKPTPKNEKKIQDDLKTDIRTKLEFDVKGMEKFTAVEKAKFREALQLGEVVLNSKAFEQEVMTSVFSETKGYSNQEIYEMFMSGKDKFNKEVDNDLDIWIHMYFSAKRVVGYTYPSTWKTWVNRRVFKKMEPAEILGNIVHEYCHNMGFSHLKIKRSSVPYRMGYIARKLGRAIG